MKFHTTEAGGTFLKTRREFRPRTRWARAAGFTLPTLGLAMGLGGLVALTLGAGCASKKPDNAPAASTTAPLASSRVLDLPASPASARPDAFDSASPADAAPTRAIHLPADVDPGASDAVVTQTPTAPRTPIETPTPALAQTPAPLAGPTSAEAGPSTYTVQKGDTLYKIARERLGDGRQWKRIVAANPGLTPGTLKAGQKISLP